MKHKLSLTLGIILLLIICLATSPAKAKSPTMERILDAIAALQTSVNNQSTAIGTLQTSVDNLESFQGNMPPAWYQILPSDQRFLLVMGDEAVLDRETGLVWEKSPSTSTESWENAQFYCNNLAVGNRKGFRLPTLQELASLVYVDTPQPIPTLPSGHPFQNVRSSSGYWSATTLAFSTSSAWAVYFSYGDVGNSSKPDGHFVWCVRGGQGVDPQ